tara:strand:- start:2187 stop:2453 length:267 start_codon:yes stop_codon:yes gene_type:complete
MKPTAREIIKDFLALRLQAGFNEVSSHNFEVDVVKHGVRYWGVKHNPSTYSRIWRGMKSDKVIEDIDVLDIVEKKTKNSESTWILQTV